MSDVTKEGEIAIDRWKRAIDTVKARKSSLNSAECELTNSKNALGKWMCPDDATSGEIFCVWFGDSLIQVEYLSDSDYIITVRTRGRSLR